MSEDQKYWKLTKSEDTTFELVQGRSHYWHANPGLIPFATAFMVKVKVAVGEGHNFHVHPEMDEILYVLNGKAEQWVEEEKMLMKQGDSLYIKANIAHATFNGSEEELEFLAILFPPEGWEAGTVDVSTELPYLKLR